MVILMIGANNCRELISAACILLMPLRMYRATFSTTTMASSTTSPTDNTMAKTVNKLSVNPISVMAAMAPKIEIGIVISGTRAVRKEPIMTTTTIPTKRMVSASVIKISCSAFRIYKVPSKPLVIDRPLGNV